MQVFLATPYSQLCDEQYLVKDEYKLFFNKLIYNIKCLGVDYFLAIERENFGKSFSLDSESTTIDFEKVKESDLICVIPGNPISGGVHIELGWASANNKPIEVFLKKNAHYSPLVTGLASIAAVNYNYYNEDFSQELIEVIIDRIRERFCIEN